MNDTVALRVLGIDPGSQRTGFGIVDVREGRLTYVASGVIRTADEALATRLIDIYRSVRKLASSPGHLQRLAQANRNRPNLTKGTPRFHSIEMV